MNPQTTNKATAANPIFLMMLSLHFQPISWLVKIALAALQPALVF
jgi:hypothetical protein